MSEIQMSVTGDMLTINGQSWSDAPFTSQLCQVLGSSDLTDGGPVIIDGKPVAKFGYFEDLGIAILESIPQSKVWRVVIYMETPPRKRERFSPYKTYGYAIQRPTQKPYGGVLELNGKQLRSPLRFAQFPLKGKLLYEHHGAVGLKFHH